MRIADYRLQIADCRLWRLMVLVLVAPVYAAVPLVTSPSWSSNSDDYSTGGGFWDIDTNGYIDFCMSNGNDMALNYNAVYLNHDGTLENNATWRSSDNGNFGHLYLGDINNDDLMDMAVAYLGPNGDHKTRVYKNVGGSLTMAPWWKSKDSTTHFDCCLGDVNLDGFLDVAISAGDAYGATREPLKIYLNHDGLLDSLPSWQSVNRVAVDAVRFADLNNDGRLDFIANAGNRLYVYYQVNDTLQHSPGWIDTVCTPQVIGSRLSVGDYDNDGWVDLASVVNGQLSPSNNSIRIYHNQSGVLDKPPVIILQRSENYSSCVAWGDANNDGWLDLAAGGWWEPVVVYENRSGVLDTLPAWSWSHSTSLVCENVLWGDTRNRYLVDADETAGGDGSRKLFRVTHLPFQEFEKVEVNSTPVPRSDYSFDPLGGYVSLRNAPPAGTDNVVFHYTYSEYPDLGLTNWEPSDHNYVFLNTTPLATAERPGPAPDFLLKVSPTLFSDRLAIQAFIPRGSRASVQLYSADGRFVATAAANLREGRHDLSFRPDGRLTKGVYFIRLQCSDNRILSRKIIRIR